MSEEQNTIKIIPTKSSTINFEVTISGLEKITPQVRFVLHKVLEQVDWVVICTQNDDKTWQAVIPPLKDIKKDKCNFSVEVVVDEFYFKPAEGSIVFIKSDVDIAKEKKPPQQPTVSKNFKVSQETIESNTKQLENSLTKEQKNVGLIFDAQHTATKIIESVMSEQNKSSIFKRDKDGKRIIPGLETIEQREYKNKVNKSIQEILK